MLKWLENVSTLISWSYNHTFQSHTYNTQAPSFVELSKCNINYEYPRLIILAEDFHLADLPFYQYLMPYSSAHIYIYLNQNWFFFCSVKLINAATASSLGQLIYTHMKKTVGRKKEVEVYNYMILFINLWKKSLTWFN